MNMESLILRDNPERWSHPELADLTEEMLAYDTYDRVIINPDVPMAERIKAAEELMPPQMEMTEEIAARVVQVEVNGPVEGEPVTVTIAQPANPKKRMACVINVAAGGLVGNDASPSPLDLSDIYGCVGVTFSYATLLEGGAYPRTIDEAEAAYLYILEHAKEYNINPKRIVLYGLSSGGHIAFSLCHRLKARGITPRGCVGIVPILDERLTYPSSQYKCTVWGTNQSWLMGEQWLGRQGNPAHVPAEAFANHATVEECVGLPPTIIHCTANDIYNDPCMAYASKLNQAGVYVGLHMWPGSTHDALYTSYLSHRNEPEDYPYTYEFQQTLEADVRMLIDNDLSRKWVVEEVLSELDAQKAILEPLKG